MIISVHGFDFAVDVSDWTDTASAESCVDRLSQWLSAQPASDVKAMHQHYSQPEYWELEETAAASAVSAAMGQIWLDVTADWHSRPDSGHNFEITGV